MPCENDSKKVKKEDLIIKFDKLGQWSMEKRCWDGYRPTSGKKPYEEGSCEPIKKGDMDLNDKIEQLLKHANDPATPKEELDLITNFLKQTVETLSKAKKIIPQEQEAKKEAKRDPEKLREKAQQDKEITDETAKQLEEKKAEKEAADKKRLEEQQKVLDSKKGGLGAPAPKPKPKPERKSDNGPQGPVDNEKSTLEEFLAHHMDVMRRHIAHGRDKNDPIFQQSMKHVQDTIVKLNEINSKKPAGKALQDLEDAEVKDAEENKALDQAVNTPDLDQRPAVGQKKRGDLRIQEMANRKDAPLRNIINREEAKKDKPLENKPNASNVNIPVLKWSMVSA
jgi:hypothetical protein